MKAQHTHTQTTHVKSEAPKSAAAELRLEPSWKKAIGDEFEKPYMKELKAFLKAEIKSGKKIYPKPAEYFNAFEHTPFDYVKVVILGQDPYHGPGQAHGLAFSVKPGVALPPSLRNIYKELKTDVEVAPPDHGYLMPWADQGVLLLNSVLTVEEGKAAAHQGKGWEKLTDRAIHALNEDRENLVFILWGAYAQKKASFVDTKRHLVLSGVHPSPLSAARGFFGSKVFSKTNTYLRKNGVEEIDWQLPTLSTLNKDLQ